MISSGFVFLYRAIFSHEIWKDIHVCRLFLWLFGNAVFAEGGVVIKGVYIKRGQFLRSYRKLIEDLAYNENNQLKHYTLPKIKRMIDKLEKEEMISKEKISDDAGTLFTIINYDKFQPMLHSQNDSTQYFQGLDEACSRQVTGLVTPPTSIPPNTEASELTPLPEHVTGLVQGLDTASNKNNKIINNKVNKSKTCIQFEEIIFPEKLINIPGFRNVFNDWYNFRKEIKKPMTATALKLQLSDLLKWYEEGQDIIAIIRRSIVNHYQGLFPLNGKGNKQADFEPKTIIIK